MIFRPTQRLCKKIKGGPFSIAPLHDNPYADWSARLFTANRTQHVLLTNTASLYSVLMPGRGITDEASFLDRSLEAMRHYMQDDALSLLFSKFIAPATGIASFHKPLSRSITGSMNELEYFAKVYLEEDQFAALDATTRLNNVPFSALGYANPREAFIRLEA